MFFAKSVSSDVFIPLSPSLYSQSCGFESFKKFFGLSQVHVTIQENLKDQKQAHMRLKYYCTLCILVKRKLLPLFDFPTFLTQ